MSDNGIQLENISKRYVLHKQKPFIAKEVYQRYIRGRDNREIFMALQDVSFAIKKGESVAFVGHNGAGKSTLLSIIAGTTKPSSGHLDIQGNIGAMLELGAGFHPDLTGRENIYLNASLLGYNEEQIEEQFDNILAFSGLDQFIDVPLRNYSSGMTVRLGFSVSIHMDPDILIMDEVFAVGDQDFQAKCLNRIRRFKDEGKTLLFVSHNLNSLKHICRRAIWLDHGRIKADDDMVSIIRAYRMPESGTGNSTAVFAAPDPGHMTSQPNPNKAAHPYPSRKGGGPLAGLDALVFSSHKTATQTILNTLLLNGVQARHAHLPVNLGLSELEFMDATEQYAQTHGRKLKIITVFREPLDRIMSSFFQSLQVHYYAHTRYIKADINLQLLPASFDRSFKELASLFEDYMRMVDGFGESIHTLNRLFNYPLRACGFNPETGWGHYQLKYSEVFAFRFDQLLNDLDILERALTIRLPRRKDENVTSAKAHYGLYQTFRKEFRTSQALIQLIYDRRKDLINTFYPGAFEMMLAGQLERYTSHPSS